MEDRKQTVVDMRKKILANEPVSDEELAHAIGCLRELRAANASSTAAKKAKSEPKQIPKTLDLGSLFAKKEEGST